MADSKSKTAKQDEGKGEELATTPASASPKPEEPAAEQNPGTPPAGDPADEQGAGTPPANDPPPSHMAVLILRDERVGKVDYKPGATPTLSYDEAQRLIKRGGADGNEKAVRAAKAARKKD